MRSKFSSTPYHGSRAIGGKGSTTVSTRTVVPVGHGRLATSLVAAAEYPESSTAKSIFIDPSRKVEFTRRSHQSSRAATPNENAIVFWSGSQIQFLRPRSLLLGFVEAKHAQER